MAGKKTCFLDLPAEIRNTVYQMALVKADIITLPDDVPGSRSSAQWYLHEPALLAASSQIRHEALPVFYSNNTFQAPYSGAACVFFQQLGSERCKMLRHLRAFNFLVLTGTYRKDWLRTVWESVHRLEKESGASLYRDALLVPFHDDGNMVVWKRLI